MKDRIKELRKSLKLTQQAFADRLGIKQNTVALYEMGRSGVSDGIIKSICREFNVNETWLRTGEGEMFVEKSRMDTIAEFAADLFNTDMKFKRDLIEVLAKLDESSWKELEKIANMFIETASKKEE